jgi:uncharacterized protein
MSSPPLPRYAELRKLAAAGGQLRGSVELCALERLRGATIRADGQADVDLHGGIDDEGYRYVAGRIRTTLIMQCQRCMDELGHAVDAPVNLALVWRDEEIPSLPSRFEGLVAGTAPTDLYELVEEELLLALPLVVRHPEGECSTGVLETSTG